MVEFHLLIYEWNIQTRIASYFNNSGFACPTGTRPVNISNRWSASGTRSSFSLLLLAVGLLGIREI